jgi:asparagine synthase (glutamine-hydrolysing)
MYANGTATDRSILDQYFASLYRRHERGSALTKMTAVDIAGWMPDYLLLRSDKMSMAASIELRVPFLDHAFVELCLSLPDKEKIRWGTQKYLLRTVMQGVLPEKILTREKKGFPVPLSKWFRGELLAPLREILCDKRSRERGYVNPGYVDGILKRHTDGAEDHSIRLYYLLVLEMWHRKYIDVVGG